jgi:hypothetical protein
MMAFPVTHGLATRRSLAISSGADEEGDVNCRAWIVFMWAFGVVVGYIVGVSRAATRSVLGTHGSATG